MKQLLIFHISNTTPCNQDNLSSMARLKITISDELMAKVLACVQQLWPDEGVRALGRFVRDSIRRLERYCNGRSRHTG